LNLGNRFSTTRSRPGASSLSGTLSTTAGIADSGKLLGGLTGQTAGGGHEFMGVFAGTFRTDKRIIPADDNYLSCKTAGRTNNFENGHELLLIAF
jgi:hypothetical protein